MEDTRLFLGIDGGGTGCRARLADAQGRVLGEGRAGPASVRLGIDVAWRAVMAAADEALRMSGINPTDHMIFACAGLAGISRAGAQATLEKKPHPFARVLFTSDSHIACLGAHDGGDGGIVIAGTGSIAFSIINHRETRIGGYGIPVSDEGSGAAIGTAAVRSLLRAQDGRLPATALTHALLQKMGGSTAGIIAWMDGASATDYATLAPLALDYAKSGDTVARDIAMQAGRDIGALITALSHASLPETRMRIALLGGLSARLAPWLPSSAAALLAPALGDGMDGAIGLAKRQA